MRLHIQCHRGFTIIEALISLSLAAVFLSSMLAVWTFSTKNFKEESMQAEARFSLEKALERIKADVRLTDGNNILFYPLNSAPYTAVSMPSTSADANGFYAFSSDALTWDHTLIYHVYYESGTFELRRTVFNSYATSASTRQSQLDSVVAAGGDGAATTTTLFEGTAVNFEIVPASPSFDGYSASLALSTLTSFGSALLTPGNHLLRFTVSDKNASSSSYKMGFDQFVAAPSGESGQEAESLSISASSGKSSTEEDMSGYPAAGLWKGNYQLEYQSSAAADYIEFGIYNDQWMESNFENMAHVNTEVTGTDPALVVMSRENQSLLPAWSAESQSAATSSDNTGTINGLTIRNIIEGSSIIKGGQLVRFKFRAASDGNLSVTAAYFGERSPGTYNFSGSAAQLKFNNGTVAEGIADAVGAVGSTGPTMILIPAGEHAWTNWIEVPITNPSSSDYLISFSVDADSSLGHDLMWDPSGGSTQTYYENGATANAVWTPADPGLGSDDIIHAVEEISAWEHYGVATSQVYDTKMPSPTYGQISWSADGGGTYSLKARSANNVEMTGATDWSAAPSSSSSPSALSAGNNRYIQFQATLTTASPYTTYPELDDVTLQWPGQTTLVEFSGIYTKRPNYGMFTATLDGSALYNALDVSLTGTKNYQGRDYETTISASIRAKNTGK